MATYKVIFPTCGCGQIKAFECAVGTTRHDGVSLPSANSWQLRSLRKTLDLICFVLTYFESVPEGFCQGFGKQSIDSSLANHPNKTWSTVVLSPPIHKRPTSVNEEKKKGLGTQQVSGGRLSAFWEGATDVSPFHCVSVVTLLQQGTF